MGIRTGGGRVWAEFLPPPLLNRLKFEPGVSNRCHDVLMMSANLSASAILNITVLIIVSLLTEVASYYGHIWQWIKIF